MRMSFTEDLLPHGRAGTGWLTQVQLDLLHVNDGLDVPQRKKKGTESVGDGKRDDRSCLERVVRQAGRVPRRELSHRR